MLAIVEAAGIRLYDRKAGKFKNTAYCPFDQQGIAVQEILFAENDELFLLTKNVYDKGWRIYNTINKTKLNRFQDFSNYPLYDGIISRDLQLLILKGASKLYFFQNDGSQFLLAYDFPLTGILYWTISFEDHKYFLIYNSSSLLKTYIIQPTGLSYVGEHKEELTRFIELSKGNYWLALDDNIYKFHNGSINHFQSLENKDINGMKFYPNDDF